MNPSSFWAGAVSALRRDAGSAAALVAAVALTVAVAAPSLWFVGRLELPPVHGGGWDAAWSSLASGPDAARARALHGLTAVLAAATIALLAVALLTVAALSVARAAQRRGDLLVRRVVGASRRALTVAALVEGVLLGGTALAGGLIVAVVVVRWAPGVWPGDVGAGGLAWALLATGGIVVCVLVGALFPLVFARRRTPGADAGPAGVPLFVPAVQFGLGLIALIAGAQLGEHGVAPTRADGDGVLLSVKAGDSLASARAARYAALLRELRRDTTVAVASLASHGTLLGLGMTDMITTDCGNCSQGGIRMPLRAVAATSHLATADTFRAIGLRVLEGRALADGDSWHAPRVAVVSSTLAANYFDGGRALGRHVRVGAPDAWYTVVGVVDDGVFAGVGASTQPRSRVYLSALQHPAGALELLVRPLGATPARAGGPMGDGVPERELLASETGARRWFSGAIRLHGWAALVVGLLGMVAVMRLWVRGAIPELALRRAVGARRRHVLGRVALRALLVAAGGTAIGWWLAPLGSELLQRALPEVPRDALGLVGVPLAVLLAATLVAAIGPAWAAARASPAAPPGFPDL